MRSRPPKRLGEDELWAYALKALAARARSSADMRRLLSRRAEKPEHAEAAVSKLKQRGYLDDRRFAQLFATARLENQRQGSRRVLQDLRARSVSAEVAEKAVREAYAESDETELIREHLGRRLRNEPFPTAPNKVASLYRSLRRAGFAHGAILDELRRRKADRDLLESLQDEESPDAE